MLSDRHYEKTMLADYDAWDVRGCIGCGLIQRRSYLSTEGEPEKWVEMSELEDDAGNYDKPTRNYWRGMRLFQGGNYET